VGAAIRSGVAPFAGIGHVLTRARTRVANLESPLSDAPVTQRVDLRAPSSATASLKARWNVLGLANNPSNDAGLLAH
jgi:hypothetical protein